MARRAITGLLTASVAVCAEVAGLTEWPSTGQLAVFALSFVLVFALQWMGTTDAARSKKPAAITHHRVSALRGSLKKIYACTLAHTRAHCGTAVPPKKSSSGKNGQIWSTTVASSKKA